MKSRAFWTLQIGGWLAFVAALMVPWLGAFPLPRMLRAMQADKARELTTKLADMRTRRDSPSGS